MYEGDNTDSRDSMHLFTGSPKNYAKCLIALEMFEITLRKNIWVACCKKKITTDLSKSIV